MEFVIPISKAKHGFNLVYDIANTKSAFLNSNMVLECEDNNLVISASNREIVAKVILDGVNIISPGKLVVDSVSLHSFLSSFSDRMSDKNSKLQPIHFKFVGDKLYVRAKIVYSVSETSRISKSLPILDDSGFSVLPRFDANKALHLNGHFFRDGLSLILYAVSSDETRGALNGIHISVEDGVCSFVAANGQELAEFSFETDLEPFSCTIGNLFASKLLKIIHPEENVFFYFSRNNIFLSSGEVQLFGSLLQEDFPQYKPLLTIQDKQIRFRRDVLVDISSIFRSSLTLDDIMEFKLKNSKVSISSQKQGIYIDDITVTGYNDDIDFFFSPLAFSRVISKLTDPEVTMYFKDNMSPVLFREDKDRIARFSGLIMPLRG